MDIKQRRDPALGGLRCLSHFFNFILLVVGAGAAALGLWIYFILRMDDERIDTLGVAGLMYLIVNLCPIVEGIFIVIVVLLGAVGICTLHRCTLIWYFSFVMITCVASLMLTIMTFIVFFMLSTTIDTTLDDYVQNEYGLFGKEDTTHLLDSIHKSFNCCGTKSYEDWRSSEWYKTHRLGYFDPLDAPVHPLSCCVTTSDEQPVNQTECVHANSVFPNKFINGHPCGEQIHDWLHWYTLYLGCAGVAIFVFTFIEIGVTSVLIHALGPLHYKPKTSADQHTLTTVYSESEDSWISHGRHTESSENSLKRPTSEANNEQEKKQNKNTEVAADTRPTKGTENGHLPTWAYVNTAFRAEAEEQATHL